MTNPDPWAVAASTSGAANGSTNSAGATAPDREAEYRALDPNANPFAARSEIMGGGGIRGPQWPDLVGRLIVLKPGEKKLNQPVPNQPDNKQDFYVCEMTVLDGGTLTVVTPAREAKGDQPAQSEQRNDYEVPMTFPDWWAYGKAITTALDNLKLPLLLGVVQRCPTGPEYRKGMTWEGKAREVEAWLANPAKIAKPQWSWDLIDPTPEQQALAMEWYRNKSA